MLTEWAYAGFFFDAVLAYAAHYVAGGGAMFSIIALVAIIVSRFFYSRIPRGALSNNE
jgi:hypothetical protein